MKPLREYLTEAQNRRTARTELDDIHNTFYERLNPAYKAYKGKNLSHKVLRMRLAPFIRKNKDYSLLYALLSECKQAENFSKHFWWATRTKKI